MSRLVTTSIPPHAALLERQVASGIAGSFFGEALFRMANLVLEQGGGMTPAWRE